MRTVLNWKMKLDRGREFQFTRLKTKIKMSDNELMLKKTKLCYRKTVSFLLLLIVYVVVFCSCSCYTHLHAAGWDVVCATLFVLGVRLNTMCKLLCVLLDANRKTNTLTRLTTFGKVARNDKWTVKIEPILTVSIFGVELDFFFGVEHDLFMKKIEWNWMKFFFGFLRWVFFGMRCWRSAYLDVPKYFQVL